MAVKKFYITAAIPYVNGKPHLGHALEFVQCDTIKRYKGLVGYKVCLVSGSDENGLKIVQAAEQKKVTPQALADKNTVRFKNLVKHLGIDIDVWRRGSDKKFHWPGTHDLWRLAVKNGDIYKKKYGGFYCVGCEDFYTKKDLVDGKCPEHLTIPDWVEEENYFFRLSRYQKGIETLIASDKLLITPQARKNEALAFVRSGLEDFSISRTKTRAKGWGIPVPDDPSQIIYTWFDALTIYMTAVGYGYNQGRWLKWWPADLHVIGKGILRFHAVYWLGMLLSAKLPLPTSIFVHGYIASGGQKMSKTIGNVIDPLFLIKKYGTDPLRYYLLREIPAHGDGDFTESRFKELYNADLANGLGNLVARVARLSELARLKVKTLESQHARLHPTIRMNLDNYRFDIALQTISRRVTNLDQQIQTHKLWDQPESKRKALEAVVGGIREVAFDLQPFLPETAEKILKQFSGPKIKSAEPLFPRLR